MIHQQTQAGERVLVVTICAGDAPPGPLSAFAQSLHDRWQTPTSAVAQRRAEDVAALQILGAEALHLALPDCIYRGQGGEHWYASEDAIFGDVHPAEAELIEQLARQFARQLRGLGPGRVYVPYGLGHHVDHQLTRRAAERAGPVYAYYEDYPYAEREAVAAPNLTAEMMALQPANIAAKVQAMAAYTSQISSFWPDREAMDQAIHQFAQRVGGRLGGGELAERVWRDNGRLP
jgi:LmbE family N-acetylglucosaminyl deacetylase